MTKKNNILKRLFCTSEPSDLEKRSRIGSAGSASARIAMLEVLEAHKYIGKVCFGAEDEFGTKYSIVSHKLQLKIGSQRMVGFSVANDGTIEREWRKTLPAKTKPLSITKPTKFMLCSSSELESHLQRSVQVIVDACIRLHCSYEGTHYDEQQCPYAVVNHSVQIKVVGEPTVVVGFAVSGNGKHTKQSFVDVVQDKNEVK
eukprot:g6095.t1